MSKALIDLLKKTLDEHADKLQSQPATLGEIQQVLVDLVGALESVTKTNMDPVVAAIKGLNFEVTVSPTPIEIKVEPTPVHVEVKVPDGKGKFVPLRLKVVRKGNDLIDYVDLVERAA